MKLHTTDAIALVEIWAGIKSYVPAKDQKACAEQFIIKIDDAGLIDFESAGDELFGICDIFDAVLRIYCYENHTQDNADDFVDWDD